MYSEKCEKEAGEFLGFCNQIKAQPEATFSRKQFHIFTGYGKMDGGRVKSTEKPLQTYLPGKA